MKISTEIFNNYAGGWAVIFVGAFEAISVSWFYGFGNFKKDIELMIGKRFTKYKIFYIWNIFWAVITPGILLVNFFKNSLLFKILIFEF